MNLKPPLILGLLRWCSPAITVMAGEAPLEEGIQCMAPAWNPPVRVSRSNQAESMAGASTKPAPSDLEESKRFGFDGTPAFLIHGISLRGVYPEEDFIEIIHMFIPNACHPQSSTNSVNP